MNKMFTIYYECEGKRNIDYLIVFSNNIVNAIKEFCNTQFEIGGIKFTYNEPAITKIEIREI